MLDRSKVGGQVDSGASSDTSKLNRSGAKNVAGRVDRTGAGNVFKTSDQDIRDILKSVKRLTQSAMRESTILNDRTRRQAAEKVLKNPLTVESAKIRKYQKIYPELFEFISNGGAIKVNYSNKENTFKVDGLELLGLKDSDQSQKIKKQYVEFMKAVFNESEDGYFHKFLASGSKDLDRINIYSQVYSEESAMIVKGHKAGRKTSGSAKNKVMEALNILCDELGMSINNVDKMRMMGMYYQAAVLKNENKIKEYAEWSKDLSPQVKNRNEKNWSEELSKLSLKQKGELVELGKLIDGYLNGSATKEVKLLKAFYFNADFFFKFNTEWVEAKQIDSLFSGISSPLAKVNDQVDILSQYVDAFSKENPKAKEILVDFFTGKLSKPSSKQVKVVEDFLTYVVKTEISSKEVTDTQKNLFEKYSFEQIKNLTPAVKLIDFQNLNQEPQFVVFSEAGLSKPGAPSLTSKGRVKSSLDKQSLTPLDNPIEYFQATVMGKNQDEVYEALNWNETLHFYGLKLNENKVQQSTAEDYENTALKIFKPQPMVEEFFNGLLENKYQISLDGGKTWIKFSPESFNVSTSFLASSKNFIRVSPAVKNPKNIAFYNEALKEFIELTKININQVSTRLSTMSRTIHQTKGMLATPGHKILDVLDQVVGFAQGVVAPDVHFNGADLSRAEIMRFKMVIYRDQWIRLMKYDLAASFAKGDRQQIKKKLINYFGKDKELLKLIDSAENLSTVKKYVEELFYKQWHELVTDFDKRFSTYGIKINRGEKPTWHLIPEKVNDDELTRLTKLFSTKEKDKGDLEKVVWNLPYDAILRLTVLLGEDKDVFWNIIGKAFNDDNAAFDMLDGESVGPEHLLRTDVFKTYLNQVIDQFVKSHENLTDEQRKTLKTNIKNEIYENKKLFTGHKKDLHLLFKVNHSAHSELLAVFFNELKKIDPQTSVAEVKKDFSKAYAQTSQKLYLTDYGEKGHLYDGGVPSMKKRYAFALNKFLSNLNISSASSKDALEKIGMGEHTKELMIGFAKTIIGKHRRSASENENIEERLSAIPEREKTELKNQKQFEEGKEIFRYRNNEVYIKYSAVVLMQKRLQNALQKDPLRFFHIWDLQQIRQNFNKVIPKKYGGDNEKTFGDLLVEGFLNNQFDFLHRYEPGKEAEYKEVLQKIKKATDVNEKRALMVMLLGIVEDSPENKPSTIQNDFDLINIEKQMNKYFSDKDPEKTYTIKKPNSVKNDSYAQNFPLLGNLVEDQRLNRDRFVSQLNGASFTAAHKFSNQKDMTEKMQSRIGTSTVWDHAKDTARIVTTNIPKYIPVGDASEAVKNVFGSEADDLIPQAKKEVSELIDLWNYQGTGIDGEPVTRREQFWKRVSQYSREAAGWYAGELLAWDDVIDLALTQSIMQSLTKENPINRWRSNFQSQKELEAESKALTKTLESSPEYKQLVDSLNRGDGVGAMNAFDAFLLVAARFGVFIDVRAFLPTMIATKVIMNWAPLWYTKGLDAMKAGRYWEGLWRLLGAQYMVGRFKIWGKTAKVIDWTTGSLVSIYDLKKNYNKNKSGLRINKYLNPLTETDVANALRDLKNRINEKYPSLKAFKEKYIDKYVKHPFALAKELAYQTEAVKFLQRRGWLMKMGGAGHQGFKVIQGATNVVADGSFNFLQEVVAKIGKSPYLITRGTRKAASKLGDKLSEGGPIRRAVAKGISVITRESKPKKQAYMKMQNALMDMLNIGEQTAKKFHQDVVGKLTEAKSGETHNAFTDRFVNQTMAEYQNQLQKQLSANPNLSTADAQALFKEAVYQTAAKFQIPKSAAEKILGDTNQIFSPEEVKGGKLTRKVKKLYKNLAKKIGDSQIQKLHNSLAQNLNQQMRLELQSLPQDLSQKADFAKAVESLNKKLKAGTISKAEFAQSLQILQMKHADVASRIIEDYKSQKISNPEKLYKVYSNELINQKVKTNLGPQVAQFLGDRLHSEYAENDYQKIKEVFSPRRKMQKELTDYAGKELRETYDRFRASKAATVGLDPHQASKRNSRNIIEKYKNNILFRNTFDMSRIEDKTKIERHDDKFRNLFIEKLVEKNPAFEKITDYYYKRYIEGIRQVYGNASQFDDFIRKATSPDVPDPVKTYLVEGQTPPEALKLTVQNIKSAIHYQVNKPFGLISHFDSIFEKVMGEFEQHALAKGIRSAQKAYAKADVVEMTSSVFQKMNSVIKAMNVDTGKIEKFEEKMINGLKRVRNASEHISELVLSEPTLVKSYIKKIVFSEIIGGEIVAQMKNMSVSEMNALIKQIHEELSPELPKPKELAEFRAKNTGESDKAYEKLRQDHVHNHLDEVIQEKYMQGIEKESLHIKTHYENSSRQLEKALTTLKTQAKQPGFDEKKVVETLNQKYRNKLGYQTIQWLREKGLITDRFMNKYFGEVYQNLPDTEKASLKNLVGQHMKNLAEYNRLYHHVSYADKLYDKFRGYGATAELLLPDYIYETDQATGKTKKVKVEDTPETLKEKVRAVKVEQIEQKRSQAATDHDPIKIRNKYGIEVFDSNLHMTSAEVDQAMKMLKKSGVTALAVEPGVKLNIESLTEAMRHQVSGKGLKAIILTDAGAGKLNLTSYRGEIRLTQKGWKTDTGYFEDLKTLQNHIKSVQDTLDAKAEAKKTKLDPNQRKFRQNGATGKDYGELRTQNQKIDARPRLSTHAVIDQKNADVKVSNVTLKMLKGSRQLTGQMLATVEMVKGSKTFEVAMKVNTRLKQMPGGGVSGLIIIVLPMGKEVYMQWSGHPKDLAKQIKGTCAVVAQTAVMLTGFHYGMKGAQAGSAALFKWAENKTELYLAKLETKLAATETKMILKGAKVAGAKGARKLFAWAGSKAVPVAGWVWMILDAPGTAAMITNIFSKDASKDLTQLVQEKVDIAGHIYNNSEHAFSLGITQLSLMLTKLGYLKIDEHSTDEEKEIYRLLVSINGDPNKMSDLSSEMGVFWNPIIWQGLKGDYKASRKALINLLTKAMQKVPGGQSVDPGKLIITKESLKFFASLVNTEKKNLIIAANKNLKLKEFKLGPASLETFVGGDAKTRENFYRYLSNLYSLGWLTSEDVLTTQDSEDSLTEKLHADSQLKANEIHAAVEVYAQTGDTKLLDKIFKPGLIPVLASKTYGHALQQLLLNFRTAYNLKNSIDLSAQDITVVQKIAQGVSDPALIGQEFVTNQAILPYQKESVVIRNKNKVYLTRYIPSAGGADGAIQLERKSLSGRRPVADSQMTNEGPTPYLIPAKVIFLKEKINLKEVIQNEYANLNLSENQQKFIYDLILKINHTVLDPDQAVGNLVIPDLKVWQNFKGEVSDEKVRWKIAAGVGSVETTDYLHEKPVLEQLLKNIDLEGAEAERHLIKQFEQIAKLKVQKIKFDVKKDCFVLLASDQKQYVLKQTKDNEPITVYRFSAKHLFKSKMKMIWQEGKWQTQQEALKENHLKHAKQTAHYLIAQKEYAVSAKNYWLSKQGGYLFVTGYDSMRGGDYRRYHRLKNGKVEQISANDFNREKQVELDAYYKKQINIEVGKARVKMLGEKTGYDLLRRSAYKSLGLDDNTWHSINRNLPTVFDPVISSEGQVKNLLSDKFWKLRMREKVVELLLGGKIRINEKLEVEILDPSLKEGLLLNVDEAGQKQVKIDPQLGLKALSNESKDYFTWLKGLHSSIENVDSKALKSMEGAFVKNKGMQADLAKEYLSWIMVVLH